MQYLQGSATLAVPQAQGPQARSAGWRRWIIEGLLGLALLAGFQAWQLRDTPRGPAPQFAGTRLDGSHFDLDAWRAGHPTQAVLLYFWAEWCAICKTTAGNVSGIARDWPVTSIAVQSGSPEAIIDIMQKAGYGWPTLPDPRATILAQYALPGTPAFVIIAPDGEIRFVSLGFTSELGLRLRLWWASR